MKEKSLLKLPRIAAFLAFLLLLPAFLFPGTPAMADDKPAVKGEVDTFDLSLVKLDEKGVSYAYVGLHVYGTALSEAQGRAVTWTPKSRFVLAKVPADGAKTTTYIEERFFDIDTKSGTRLDVKDLNGNVVGWMDQIQEKIELTKAPDGYEWYADIAYSHVLPKEHETDYMAQVSLSSHYQRLTYRQGYSYSLVPRVNNQAKVEWIGFAPKAGDSCIAAGVACARVDFGSEFNPKDAEGSNKYSGYAGSIPAGSTWAFHFLYPEKVSPILDSQDNVEIGRTTSGHFRYEISDAQRKRLQQRAGRFAEHWFMSYNQPLASATYGGFTDSVYTNSGRLGGALASATLKINPPKSFWDLSKGEDVPENATPIFVDKEKVDVYNGGSEIRFTRAIKVTYKLADGAPEGAQLLDKDNKPLTGSLSGYVRFNTAAADTLPVPGTKAPEKYRFAGWKAAGEGNAKVTPQGKLRVPDAEVVFEAFFEEIPAQPGTEPTQPGTDPGSNSGKVPGSTKKPVQPPAKLPKTGN